VSTLTPIEATIWNFSSMVHAMYFDARKRFDGQNAMVNVLTAKMLG